MAIITNPDGSYTLTDDTGREPPVTYNPTPSASAYPPLQAGPSTARFEDSNIIRETPNFSSPDQPPLPVPPAPIANLPVAPEPREDTGLYDGILRNLPPEWQPALPPPQVAPGIMPDPASVRPAPARSELPSNDLTLFNKPTAMAEPPSAMTGQALAMGPEKKKTSVLDAFSPIVQPSPQSAPLNITGVVGGEGNPFTSQSAAEDRKNKLIEERFKRDTPVIGGAAAPTDLAPGPSQAPAAGQVGTAGAPLPAGQVVAKQWALQPTPASPGGVIPEKDILKSFTLKKAGDIPDDLKQAVEDAFRSRAINAVVEGEKGQAAKVVQALGYQKAADDARSQLIQLNKTRQEQEAKVHEAIGQLNNEISQVKKLGKENPSERYWERKGVFGASMTKIGVALGELGSAVTGQPNRVAQMVRDEINDEVNFQKQKIDSGHAAIAEKNGVLAQMRASFLSPEAAEMASRALLAEVYMNEIKSYAELTDSYDVRKKAMDEMTKISFDAAIWKAQAAEAESGERHEAWKHQARQVVGGSLGGKPTYGEAVKRLISLGATFEQANKILSDENMEKGKPIDRGLQKEMESARERKVQLPDGTIMWASQPTVAKEIEGDLSDLGQLVDNLDEIKRIVNSGPWETVKGTSEERRLKTRVANVRLLMKKPIIKEAMTKGELPNYAPLTTEDVQDTFTWAHANDASIDESRAVMEQRIDYAKRRLYNDPDLTQGYAKGAAQKPPSAKREF